MQIYVDRKGIVLILGLPMVLMNLVLIFSMHQIKKSVKGLDAVDFYHKEKLVFLHVFLFTVYTILWFIYQILFVYFLEQEEYSIK